MLRARTIILILALLLLPISICNGEITITPVTDIEIQFNKDYEDNFAGTSLNCDISGQTYTLGANISTGALTLTPKVGLWDSEININNIIKLKNEVGFTAGIEAKYDIYKPIDDVTISLVGAYNYKHSEIDSFDVNPWGIHSNSSISIHSYEIGPRVSYSGLPIDITPYIGIALSDSSLNVDTEIPYLSDFDANASENIGLRLGFSGQPIKDLTLGLDAKLIDEEAVTLVAAYSF